MSSDAPKTRTPAGWFAPAAAAPFVLLGLRLAVARLAQAGLLPAEGSPTVVALLDAAIFLLAGATVGAAVFWAIRRWTEGPSRPPQPQVAASTPESGPTEPVASAPKKPPVPPMAELKARLRRAQGDQDAEAVLEVRAALRKRISPAGREKLDAKLGPWFSRFFEVRLRSGKATEIAAVLQRAVREFSGVPQMKHLEEVLPFVLQAAALHEQARREVEEPEGTDAAP